MAFTAQDSPFSLSYPASWGSLEPGEGTLLLMPAFGAGLTLADMDLPADAEAAYRQALEWSVIPGKSSMPLPHMNAFNPIAPASFSSRRVRAGLVTAIVSPLSAGVQAPSM